MLHKEKPYTALIPHKKYSQLGKEGIDLERLVMPSISRI